MQVNELREIIGKAEKGISEIIKKLAEETGMVIESVDVNPFPMNEIGNYEQLKRLGVSVKIKIQL